MSEILQNHSDSDIAQREIRTVQYKHGRQADALDKVAAEEPLEIRVRGRAINVTMRTPGNDAELAIGFLLAEGIIRKLSDILKVEHCDLNEHGNVIQAQLAPEVSVDFARMARHVLSSSSCGLCGKVALEAVCTSGLATIDTQTGTIAADRLLSLPGLMSKAQQTFQHTGGLHAAALFDHEAAMIALREDVGRHNAVDKVVGYAVRSGQFPLTTHTLLVSGRTSFEIMQKALAARIPIVASISAPSSLAVEFAEKNGQTLVGFLRGERFNIYTHPHRIQ